MSEILSQKCIKLKFIFTQRNISEWVSNTIFNSKGKQEIFSLLAVLFSCQALKIRIF